MNGKQKCNILKNIRRDIAKANDIPLEIPECTHKGDCLGTCPRCEAEVRFLERGLEARRKRGLKIALAGISAGLIAVNTTSCDVIDNLGDLINGGEQLDGDMAVETYVTEGSLSFLDTANAETEISTTGEFEADKTNKLVQGSMPLVTELAGEVVEEEYTLEGDIAFIPNDVGGDTVLLPDDIGGDTVFLPDETSVSLIKGLLLATEDDTTYTETDDTLEDTE